MADTPPVALRNRSESPNWSLHRSQISASSSTSTRSTPKHRSPLHERSSSQQNELRSSSPTIRLIQQREEEEPSVLEDDDDGDVYSKSPFPSHPAHIFNPRTRSHGFTVNEDQGRGVSSGNQPRQSTRTSMSETLDVSSGINSSRSSHPSQSTIHPSLSTRLSSDADTLLDSSLTSFSPSTGSRFSQGSLFTTPSPTLHKEGRLSLNAAPRAQSGSSETRPDSTPRFTPSASAAAREPPETVSEEESLASSASSETFSDRRHGTRTSPDPLTPSPAPQSHDLQPSSDASASAGSLNQVASSASADDTVVRVSPSLESLAFAVISRDFGDQLHPDSGVANPYAGQGAARSGARVQYPVVRPPSASSSFAESTPGSKRQDQQPQSSRMNDSLDRRRWSAQLSTIPSESEGTSGPGTNSRRRTTIDSIASSALYPPPSQSGSFVSYPAPLFSPSRSPGYAASPHGDVDEHGDTLAELQSPVLRTQRSWLGRLSSDSRPSSASSQSSSYTTFVSNIPGWARLYYRRGERVSMNAPSLKSQSSDSRLNPAMSERSDSPLDANFPHTIWRPRNRPHQGKRNLQPPVRQDPGPSQEQPRQPEMQTVQNLDVPRRPERLHVPPPTGTTQASEISMEVSETPSGEGPFAAGTPPRTRRHISMAGMMSPHLQRDRRSVARLSTWTVPSLEDDFGFGDGGVQQAVSPQGNRQVILFILGFVFPISWMVAACLPLPPRTDYSTLVTPSQIDVERQIQQSVGPVEQRRYLKARWWRGLNRIMSGVGVVIIILVVVLAVVGTTVGM